MLPKFPQRIATNQDVMHVLADGTGGFVIMNTNDLLSGFQKIASELNRILLARLHATGIGRGELSHAECEDRAQRNQCARPHRIL